jgi:hypothetical protein
MSRELREAVEQVIAARRQGVSTKDPYFWQALDHLETVAALDADPEAGEGALDEAWREAEAALIAAERRYLIDEYGSATVDRLERFGRRVEASRLRSEDPNAQ